MPYYSITTDRNLLNTAQGDVVFLKAGVVISGGIDMRGYSAGNVSGQQSLFLYGGVFGTINDYWNNTSGHNYIEIGEDGYAASPSWGTIQLAGGGNTIINAGQLTSAAGNVIYIVGTTVGSFQDEPTTIINSGFIAASGGQASSDLITIHSSRLLRITNSGEMHSGSGTAALSGNATDGGRLINTGLIVGDIELFGGNFFIDTRTGEVQGKISTGLGNDYVSATAGDDKVFTGWGNDSLIGRDGDDWLDGDIGDDYMSGGAGDDIYIVDSGGDVVKELAGNGEDRVISSISYTLGANVEHLDLVDGITGLGNSLDNRIIGNALDNHLGGGLGNDTLSGGAGNDTLDGGNGTTWLIGGAGDDLLLVGSEATTVVEAAGEGIDRVETVFNWVLDTNIENLTLTGTAGRSGTGNALANEIIGNSGGNQLDGVAGNDTIRGLDGADRITGGLGADSLYGGTGADRFIYVSTADSTYATTGRDMIYDFSQADGDRIDLSVIDANTAAGGNQAFSGTIAASFTGISGQIRAYVSGGDTYVQADVNGDRSADLSIRIDGAFTLTATDFIL